MTNEYNNCNEHEDSRILLNCFECRKTAIKTKTPAEYIKYVNKLANDPFILESTVSLIEDIDEKLLNAIDRQMESIQKGITKLPDSPEKRDFLKKYS